LREPLGQAFNALGLEGDQGWRAVARLKVLLIIQSRAGTSGRPPAAQSKSAAPKLASAAEALASEATSTSPSAPTERDGPFGAIIPADLWQDPDVRWLTGFNEAEGHAYVVRESYEELLWWLSLPQILTLTGVTVPTRPAAAAISKGIADEMKSIEKAGYRVDLLLRSEKSSVLNQPDAIAMKATAIGSQPGRNAPMPGPEDLEPDKPVDSRPAGPGIDPEGPPEDN
jgi:hypothetical protein